MLTKRLDKVVTAIEMGISYRKMTQRFVLQQTAAKIVVLPDLTSFGKILLTLFHLGIFV